MVLEKHPVPYEETKAAMDEMTNDFPNGCKAIDVYLKLNEIAERKVSKNINTFGHQRRSRCLRTLQSLSIVIISHLISQLQKNKNYLKLLPLFGEATFI